MKREGQLSVCSTEMELYCEQCLHDADATEVENQDRFPEKQAFCSLGKKACAATK